MAALAVVGMQFDVICLLFGITQVGEARLALVHAGRPGRSGRRRGRLRLHRGRRHGARAESTKAFQGRQGCVQARRRERHGRVLARRGGLGLSLPPALHQLHDVEGVAGAARRVLRAVPIAVARVHVVTE